jgi:hypothetical protein
MRNLLRQQRLEKLERFLKKIETTTPPSHLTSRWGHQLLRLYSSHLRAERPDWLDQGAPDKYEPVNGRGHHLRMYVHGPVQKRLRTALEKLRIGDFDGLRDDLQRVISDAEGKAIASEIQSHNSAHRHKRRPYERLQEKIVRDNPTISCKEFERALRSEIGKGVILSMSDSLNEIRLVDDERIFNISGLKNRLTRIRDSL